MRGVSKTMRLEAIFAVLAKVLLFPLCKAEREYIHTEKCSYLDSSHSQINAYIDGHLLCCMCGKGTASKGDCNSSHPNTTICEACHHDEKDPSNRYYIHFEPHMESECYRKVPKQCFSPAVYHEGSVKEEPKCVCPQGMTARRGRCVKKPSPRITTTVNTASELSNIKTSTVSIEKDADAPKPVPADTTTSTTPTVTAPAVVTNTVTNASVLIYILIPLVALVALVIAILVYLYHPKCRKHATDDKENSSSVNDCSAESIDPLLRTNNSPALADASVRRPELLRLCETPRAPNTSCPDPSNNRADSEFRGAGTVQEPHDEEPPERSVHPTEGLQSPVIAGQYNPRSNVLQPQRLVAVDPLPPAQPTGRPDVPHEFAQPPQEPRHSVPMGEAALLPVAPPVVAPQPRAQGPIDTRNLEFAKTVGRKFGRGGRALPQKEALPIFRHLLGTQHDGKLGDIATERKCDTAEMYYQMMLLAIQVLGHDLTPEFLRSKLRKLDPPLQLAVDIVESELNELNTRLPTSDT